MKVKEESGKVGLRVNIQKTYIHTHSGGQDTLNLTRTPANVKSEE